MLGASQVRVWARSRETIHLTVRLSRLRGFAHVLVRRPSSDRRREHPTHTFVLLPRHARRGREFAYRGILPTDEYIRLSSVLATPIVLTSCNLPDGQAQLARTRTYRSNPWGTTSSPTPRGMNDDQSSSIYRYPRRTPKRLLGSSRSVSISDSIQTSDLVRPAARAPRGLSSEPIALCSGPTSLLAIASTVYRSVILLLAEHMPERFT